MAMTYEEQVFRQIFHNSNKSTAGFNLLVSLVGVTLFGVFLLLKFIVKGIIKMIKEREEKNIQREVHSRAVTRFLKLLQATNNTIQWNIIKSHTNRSTADMTQYINFVAFNEEKRTVEVINMLVNEVLYDTLTIVKSKDMDLNGTLLTKNDDLYKIQEDLEVITGVHINFRNF